MLFLTVRNEREVASKIAEKATRMAKSAVSSASSLAIAVDAVVENGARNDRRVG